LAFLFAGFAAAQEDDYARIRQAIQMQQAGHLAEAITEYQAFLQKHPDAAAVRSNLGAALAAEGHYTEAIQQYTLALQSMPANNGIRFNLGLSYYKAGDIKRAVGEFEAVSSALPASDPNHRRVAVLLAECYLRQGENERVVAVLDPITDSNQTDLTPDYLLGTALLHEGQTERGALLIQRLLQNGDTAEAHMLMAYTRYQAHDKQAAIVEVDRAIALNQNLPEAYSLRGRLAFLESDLKGAEAQFRKALALDPNSFDALLWLGTLLREQGRLDESHKELEHALQLRPNDIRARYQFARACSDEGDDARAATLLESLVKDDPQYTEAHRTLATIYFRLGRAEEGRRERKIAEEMNAAIEARDEQQGRNLKK
jgi:Tfp pilus assembly protein PilF